MYLTITLCSSFCCCHHGGRNCAINTFALLRLAGCPKRSGSASKLRRAGPGNGHTSNTCRSHTIPCNDVWSSSCSVPVYLSDASFTNQDIKLMFFVFGMSRFVTLLLLVTRISKYGVPALALAVLTTAVGIHSTTLFLARGAWPAQQRPDLPQMCLARGGLILRSLS
jgi:hypothetical protein